MNLKVAKIRLDQAVFDLGLASSKEQAKALILAGLVLYDDSNALKPGSRVVPDAKRIRVKQTKETSYVSRGAIKLLRAFEAWGEKIAPLVLERNVLDVGASTGGFTQVLLEKKALKVCALDVGHSQLDWKIRSDSRVHVIEKFNARNLTVSDLPFTPSLIVTDVSFISLGLLASPLRSVVSADGAWITLVKPQFEVGREFVEKGGIVRSLDAISQMRQLLTCTIEESGWRLLDWIDSPIKGGDGNQEYLALWQPK